MQLHDISEESEEEVIYVEPKKDPSLFEYEGSNTWVAQKNFASGLLFAKGIITSEEIIKEFKSYFYKKLENKLPIHGTITKEVKKIEQINVNYEILDIANKISNFDYYDILELFKGFNVEDNHLNLKLVADLEAGFNISKLRTKSKVRKYKLEDIQADLILLIREINSDEKQDKRSKLQKLKELVISKLESSVNLNKHLATMGLNEESIYYNFEEKEPSEGKIELIWKGH